MIRPAVAVRSLGSIHRGNIAMLTAAVEMADDTLVVDAPSSVATVLGDVSPVVDGAGSVVVGTAVVASAVVACAVVASAAVVDTA